MAPLFRMTTLWPHRSPTKKIVGPASYLFGFPKDFVDGLNDFVQLFPIIHTNLQANATPFWVLPKARPVKSAFSAVPRPGVVP